MSYLYGDSTPSTLEIDYIEFLRDAVDCCVQVLLADQRIANGKTRLETLERATATEVEQVQRMASVVPRAFEGASLGEAESPAARCAAAILRSAAALAAATVADVKGTFDAAVSDAASEATQQRQACAEALGRLLVKHDLPGMTSEVQIVFVGAGHYVGRAQVSTEFGVSGTLELEIPKDHLFERVVRVDRLVERLDVQAPELGGWLHKGVKLRTQHLDKLYVAGLSLGSAGDTLRLRSAPDGSGSGFDVVFAPAGGAIRLERVDEESKRGDPPFDFDGPDLSKLRRLRDKLTAAANVLTRHRRALVDVKLDGAPMRGHPAPSWLAERLLVAITPTVQEIAARSRSPGELVLRRLIAEARREEIFLSTQELKSKLEPLNERNRSLFDPLWIVPPAGAFPANVAPVPPPEPPTLRTGDPPEPPETPEPPTVRTVVPTEPPEPPTVRTVAPPPHIDGLPPVIELLDSAPGTESDDGSARLSSSEVEFALIEEHPSS